MKGPHRIAAALALVVTAATFAGVPAGAAAGRPGVAGTGSSVPGLGPIPVRGAVDDGLASGPASATVVLAPRDPAGLAAFIHRQEVAAAANRTPAVLTPAAYNSRFAPPAAAVTAVRSWAAARGLTVETVSSNRTLVRVTAPAPTLGAAFGTVLHRFHAPGVGSFVAPGAAGRLPAGLSGRVTAIAGLSDVGRLRTFSRRAADRTVDYFRAYTPADLEALYHAPPTATAGGEAVAVIATGDMAPVLSDLRLFEQRFARPVAPVRVRFVDGGSADRTNTVEWDLDTQYTTGLAPRASLVLYTGRSLNDADLLDELNAFVTQRLARQANASLGECEALARFSGFLAGADQVLAQGVAQGQTLFASSGDSGSFCPVGPTPNGVPAGLANAEYPAASPYAVGVGGTTVVAPGRRPNEIAWYGSGGGPATYEATPTWQARVGGSNLGTSRGVPDVALDADPYSGFVVVVDGQLVIVGGTSASSPAWTAFWARAEGAHRGRLGYANPVLYRLPASTFRDITAGSNGLFPATAGYDYVTGRGVPDVTALVDRA